MKYCPYCGAKIHTSVQFCTECGKKLFSEEAEEINRGVNNSDNNGSIIPHRHRENAGLVITFGLLAVLIVGVVVILSRLNNEPLGFLEDSKQIEAAVQSVVMVYSYDNCGNLLATGSGFVAYNSSTIITNNHVTEEAYEIKISTEQDHTYSISSIANYDAVSDLVILKTSEPTGLRPLRFGSSKELLKGDAVLAVGSPLGLKNTVSTGVLSGRIYDAERGIDNLQITAPISHGSSGGALFDANGNVIGITFAGYEEGQNLNFAIPIEEVERLYSSVASDRTVLEYVGEVNPGLAYYYNSEYIDSATLYSNPSIYDGKLISTVVYLEEARNTENYVILETKQRYTYEQPVFWIDGKNNIGLDLNSDSAPFAVLLTGVFTFEQELDENLEEAERYKDELEDEINDIKSDPSLWGGDYTSRDRRIAQVVSFTEAIAFSAYKIGSLDIVFAERVK